MIIFAPVSVMIFLYMAVIMPEKDGCVPMIWPQWIEAILTLFFLLSVTWSQYGNVQTKRAQLVWYAGVCVLLVAGALQTTQEWGSRAPLTTGRPANPSLNRSFWDYVYYSVITVSTVGFGDMSPSTTIARIAVIIAIIIIISVFATGCPALLEMLQQWSWHRAGALPPYTTHDRILVVGGEQVLLYHLMEALSRFRNRPQVLTLPGDDPQYNKATTELGVYVTLTNGLMAHALTAKGAASILANIIAVPAVSSLTRSRCKDRCLEKNHNACDDFLRQEYLDSLKQILLLDAEDYPE
ncbi:hypothetical protein Pmani_038389 [Petrolisthes manimaculis]|uniref:Potassium channel domain-containing protein n=1 Tax=Petrolisthes manimaculis TaxID=1843537 RepID=A0AAE1NEH7_9EUCA|nr:hypothetical protein Pmani_038389 [Petrolisthes manimaculis]